MKDEMPQAVVSVESVGKTYRAYPSPWHRLAEALSGRRRHRDFVALAGVTFQQGHGEGLALIGENGAGKSTLLKIIAGITAPSAGRVEVHGKVASILELGSGFHPEFTGRQNIVLNAALLGLSEDEVRRRTPEIVAFSELGDFIDQPVKTYSTGMAMRLGFSIATQVDPDVLIIDEALSVGDGYFQKKCMDRLRAYVGGGGTLLFCSHAMYYVSAFCERALWLRGGRVEALGPVDSVVHAYEDYLASRSKRREAVDAAAEDAAAATTSEEESRRPARLRAVALANGSAASPVRRPGEPLELDVEWEAERPDLAFHLGIGITRIDEIEVCAFSTHLDGCPALSGRTRYRARLRVPELPIVKGSFTINVFLADEEALHIYDRRSLPEAFSVQGSTYQFGLVRVPHEWDFDGGAAAS
ncbi:MAG TPA: ABC transporter ATP-binding protein [Thermoanaerobaculia bacterium]